MTKRKAVHPRDVACPRCAQPIGAPCLAPSGGTLGTDENPVHHTSRLTGRLMSDEPSRPQAPEPQPSPPAERPAPPPPAEPSQPDAPTDASRPFARAPVGPKRRTARVPHPASPHNGDAEAARADAQPALF